MDWWQVSWKLLVARGALGIVFGVMAMAWPVSTAVTLAVLWGIWAVVDGAAALAAAFTAPGAGPKIMFAVLGVLGLVAGLMAFTRPGVTVVALTWLLGIWLVVRGAVDLGATVAGARVGPVWLGVVSSVLSIVAGLVCAANPGRSAVALAFWLGLLAALWGVVFVAVLNYAQFSGDKGDKAKAQRERLSTREWCTGRSGPTRDR